MRWNEKVFRNVSLFIFISSIANINKSVPFVYSQFLLQYQDKCCERKIQYQSLMDALVKKHFINRIVPNNCIAVHIYLNILYRRNFSSFFYSILNFENKIINIYFLS